MPGADLTKAGYVQAVLDAIAAAERGNPAIRVRLILSVDRRNTAAEADEVVALTRRFASGGGVVGIDLCGDPARGDVSLFTPAFRAAREAGLKITIHFAEAECSASEAELDTIMSWYPDRLGHVIHVPERVKRVIASRKTMGLELCLSCNVHAKMISGSFEAHHFGEWWKVDGVTVVPCVSTELDIGTNQLGPL
jgi:adenosine deaminase